MKSGHINKISMILGILIVIEKRYEKKNEKKKKTKYKRDVDCCQAEGREGDDTV